MNNSNLMGTLLESLGTLSHRLDSLMLDFSSILFRLHRLPCTPNEIRCAGVVTMIEIEHRRDAWN